MLYVYRYIQSISAIMYAFNADIAFVYLLIYMLYPMFSAARRDLCIAFVGLMRLRFCFCLCLRFSRRVALFWCNRALVFVNATYLVLFRFSACALFKQFLFCSEMGKINRYIISNCFAFVDFVHIYEKLVLLFCFCFAFCFAVFVYVCVFFRSGAAVY